MSTASLQSITKKKRIFSLQEAKEMFPLVRKITENTVVEIQDKMKSLEKLSTDSVDYEDLRKDIEKRVRIWSDKIQKLGCEVKGLWLVDFDNGQGYYCWRYPEADLDYFHSYVEGFSSRIRIC